MTESIPKYIVTKNDTGFTVEIFTLPIPKGRPRLGKFRVYTPKRTTDYEDLIKIVLIRVMRELGLIPYLEAVYLTLDFSFKRPKGIKKDFVFKLTRPDADNLAKAFTDSLNGIVYGDDSQIAILNISKRWADEHSIKATFIF